VNAANDGVPETSVGAIPLNMAMPGAGNINLLLLYSDARRHLYVPLPPGGRYPRADGHVRALVVYEPTDAAYLSWFSTGTATGGGTLMGWNWTKENILLLSEFDVRQHVAEQFNGQEALITR